jgi:hypothetical protein
MKKVDFVIQNTEVSNAGLRKFTVGMLNSEHPQKTTNDFNYIIHAIKNSRYFGKLPFTLAFLEEDYPYDPENFQGTLTIVCKYGRDDITSLVLMPDIEWTRYSKDSEGNERTASDSAWNIRHNYQNWPTGRTQLTLQQSDLDAESDFPSVVTFKVEVTIRDGEGNSVGHEYLEFGFFEKEDNPKHITDRHTNKLQV